MANRRRMEHDGEGGPLSVLSREQERRFRAMAWRHVRRINPKVARRVWRNHRVIQQFPQMTGFYRHPEETDRQYINRVHGS